MSKDKRMNSKKRSNQENKPEAQPWISMRSGIIIITIISVGMALLTAIQVVPVKGWAEGLLWSAFFGAMIWVVFLGMNFINRLFRR